MLAGCEDVGIMDFFFSNPTLLLLCFGRMYEGGWNARVQQQQYSGTLS